MYSSWQAQHGSTCRYDGFGFLADDGFNGVDRHIVPRHGDCGF